MKTSNSYSQKYKFSQFNMRIGKKLALVSMSALFIGCNGPTPYEIDKNSGLKENTLTGQQIIVDPETVSTDAFSNSAKGTGSAHSSESYPGIFSETPKFSANNLTLGSIPIPISRFFSFNRL